MDVFAVIPARGGSKRVPRKNVREVGGKPLIAHTIEQAEAADEIDRSVVSTDDEDIKRVAEEYGADVPFTRPAELATDEATSPPVVEHALEWIESTGESPSIVVLLQVTTPLRTPDDIDGAIRTLRTCEDATSVASLARFETPPYWAIEYDPDGFLTPHFEEDVMWGDEIARSQDLPELYYPNGAVYAAEVEAFRDSVTFYTRDTVGYEMPRERSFDIDEPYELEVVRNLIA